MENIFASLSNDFFENYNPPINTVCAKPLNRDAQTIHNLGTFIQTTNMPGT